MAQMIDIQAHRGPDDQGMVGFSFFEDLKIDIIDDETSELAIYMQVLVLTDYLF